MRGKHVIFYLVINDDAVGDEYRSQFTEEIKKIVPP